MQGEKPGIAVGVKAKVVGVVSARNKNRRTCPECKLCEANDEQVARTVREESWKWGKNKLQKYNFLMWNVFKVILG